MLAYIGKARLGRRGAGWQVRGVSESKWDGKNEVTGRNR